MTVQTSNSDSHCDIYTLKSSEDERHWHLSILSASTLKKLLRVFNYVELFC